MPTYDFKCKKCKICFEQVCSFSDFDAGFPNLACPECKSKKVEKTLSSAPGAMFANPKDSSKWDNWYYRQGFTAEQAKKERAAAEAAHRGPQPYKKIDDTRGGKRMNFME
jgi:putative FmdB family regulatory protein